MDGCVDGWMDGWMDGQKLYMMILILYIFRINRHTSKTTVVYDQTIPEDSVVVIPINYIHYSPEYWPDPQLFKPTRYI